MNHYRETTRRDRAILWVAIADALVAVYVAMVVYGVPGL